ncbi:hypothetical protein ACOMHN_018160 [Nucella lapillus]
MFADDPDMSDLTFDPGPKHSTPIKDKPSLGLQRRDGSPAFPATAGLGKPCLPEPSKTAAFMSANGKSAPRLHGNVPVSGGSGVHVGASDMSSIMNVPYKDSEWAVGQQRKEIASLARELRARDHELDELVRDHQQQLTVWEQDRQLILRLQHKCQRLATEVKQQRPKVAGVSVRSSGERRRGSKDSTPQGELTHQSSGSDHLSLHFKELQNHTANLNDSLKEMTLAKGQLEVKEQELLTLLKLKENKLAEAERGAGELRSQVKSLQQGKDSSHQEVQQLTSLWQQRCHHLQQDRDKLVAACQEKDRQLQQATTQLQDTLQQALVLQQALTISCEREKNKDDLLTSVKARQERLNLELNQLRTLYRRQNREMMLLQLTLDTSKESDPEVSDSDKRATPPNFAGRTSASLSNTSGSPFVPSSAGLANHHSTAAELEGIRGSSVQYRSKTVPACASCGDNADSSNDHNNTSQTKLYASPQVSPSSSIVGQRQSVVGHDDREEDAGKLAQDVDTEAFWQKILSVRHGNQNIVEETKDLNPSPTKNWLTKVCTRDATAGRCCQTDLNPSPAKSWLTQDTVADDCHAQDGSYTSQVNSDRRSHGRKSPDPEFLKNSASHALSGTRAVPASHPETVENQELQQPPLLSNDPRTQHPLQQGPTPEDWLPSQQRDIPQEASVSRHGAFDVRDLDDAVVPVPRSQPQQSDIWEQPQKLRREQPQKLREQPQKLSLSEAVETFSQQHFQPKSQMEDGEGFVTGGSGHTSANPERAPALSTQFDDKLSSFLESPEEDVSYDPAGSQGSCSPASKLYRLLIESQEMIKALEVRGQPHPH